MILQCDQCNTRFRLDESKLKPGGVKVRCSKCRHVFLAGAEQKLEESEFDSILSGLGAPVSEKRPEEPPARPEPSFAAEAGLQHEEPAGVPGASQDDAFVFAPEVPKPQEAQGFDSSEFSFEEQPVLKEEAGSAPGETFDFGDFSFAAEPAETLEEQKPAAANGFEFGEVDFDAEPVMPAPGSASATKDDFDFGDFSFTDEPEVNEQPPAAEKGPLDFSEFSFAEEPTVNQAESAPAASDPFDLGELSFAEESSAYIEEPVPATEDALDFGEFSFAEEPALKGEHPSPITDDAHDFEFSFAEEPAPKTEELTAAASEPFEFGDFSFAEEPAPLQEEEAPPVEKEAFDFDEFSFAEQPPSVNQRAAADASEDVYYQELQRDQDATPAISPAVAAKRGAAQEATLDFSFGSRSKAASAPEVADEEELPPLAISSRRKGRSLLTVSIVVICVLVIVALTGAGLYLLQSGPAALQKFDQLGLGFVGKWFGMESPEEGRVTIRNPLAAFAQNKEAGEIFVVTGDVVNSYKKARASIHVKVSLFDKNGAVLLQKTAYCGNKLSKEQLETLPVAKIESIMNNQFGDSLANLGVQPGHAIGFVVAIPNVPKEAADFGVEVVGSTVAGQ